MDQLTNTNMLSKGALTQKEIEQLLGVTTMTVHLWRKLTSNPLPFRKVYSVGGKPRVLYPTNEVLSWLCINRPKIFTNLNLGGGHANQCNGTERAIYHDSERIAS